MALWKTRSMNSDQKADTFEDQDGHEKTGWEQHEQDEKCLYEDVTSHLVVEDEKMTKIYSKELPFSVSTLKTFRHCLLNYKGHDRSGCTEFDVHWTRTRTKIKTSVGHTKIDI